MITWLPAGGIEKRLCAVLPRLRDRGFAPSVCCIRERGPLAERLEEAGIPVHVIAFHSRMDPRGLLRLRRFIRDEGFALVHSHMYRANTAAALTGLLTGRSFPPLVCQIHNINTWETWRQLWMERRLSRLWNMAVAVSARVRDHMADQLHLPPERCRVIYNGVDLAEFEAVVRRGRPSRRDTFGIPDENAVVVATLCRLHPQKNPEAVVWMAAELCPRYPNLHFVVAGQGKLFVELQREQRRLGLQDRLHLLGHRDDVASVLAASDVFFLPSFKEGFSNAVVEAMAAGLPVVATDVGGNAEAVQDGESGFIVKAGDTEAMRERLERLIAAPELRARMGESARRRARLFSLEKMIDDTVEVYQMLIADKH
ncbi:MAG: glycosyltransferase family 4 protein [Candidatus Sumerlaeia bacterium]